MQTIVLNGIPVVVKEEARKHAAFEALPKRRVLFRVPKSQREDWVRNELKKAEMLLSDLVENAPNGEVEPPREFVSGESISILGRLYRLKVVDLVRDPDVEKVDDRVVVYAGESRVVRSRLRKWMKQKVADEVQQCADQFAKRVGCSYKKILVKHYERRLGGCTSSAEMRFHWGIGLLPRPLFQTVVAHEVAHLKYPKHTKEFWSLLTSLAPKQKEHHEFFRKYRRWLEF